MTEIEILTWLCIIGIIVGGVMNLRHTESTLVIRQDFREKLIWQGCLRRSLCWLSAR